MSTDKSSKGKPSTRVQRKHERNRQEILDVARAILRDGGVDAVTLASVAGELALTKQALYHYYPSKEALVRVLTIVLLNDEVETLIAAVNAEPEDARILGVVIRAFYRHYIQRLNEFRAVYCQSQLYRNPTEVLDEVLLREEINPRTRHLFDVLEARLSNGSRSTARKKKCRRLAYTGWLAALGLVTMLGVADAAKDPLIHSDADLLDTLTATFDAAAVSILAS